LPRKLEGHQPPPFEARLAKIKGKAATVSNQAEADHVLQKSEDRDVQCRFGSHEGKETLSRFLRFTTSKLQQEAARKLRFFREEDHDAGAASL
jgi:DNA topoisomerase IA